MHELIEELQQYHREKAHHLFDLEKSANTLAENDFPAVDAETLQALLEPFQNAAEIAHHHNEEIILSELRKTSAPIHRRVEDISGDHEAFNRMIDDIANKIVDQSVGCEELYACIIGFVKIYNDHANGEENIFFPIADKYLQHRHWRRIRKAWK